MQASSARLERSTADAPDVDRALPAVGLAAGVVPGRHVVALDGLRGLAVLMVMLLHFTTPMTPPAGSLAAVVRGVFQQGWIGVDLFFVLSGFLITGILSDHKGENRYFQAFYARRALRILPVYFAALVVIFHLVPLVVGPFRSVPHETELAFWLFVANFRELPYELARFAGHFWSLAIEEQFYVVWPLVVFLCSRTQARIIALVVVLTQPVVRLAALLLGVDGSAVYHHTPYRLDGLAMGALIALIMREPNGPAHLRRWRWPAGLMGAAVFVGLQVPLATLLPHIEDLRLALEFSALGLVFGAVLTGIVLANGRASGARLLSCRPLVTLGTYSYAIYLLHVPLMRLMSRFDFTQTAALGARHPNAWVIAYPAAMIVLSTMCAQVIWHVYESRFLRMKSRFPYASHGTGSAERMRVGPSVVGALGQPRGRVREYRDVERPLTSSSRHL